MYRIFCWNKTAHNGLISIAERVNETSTCWRRDQRLSLQLITWITFTVYHECYWTTISYPSINKSEYQTIRYNQVNQQNKLICSVLPLHPTCFHHWTDKMINRNIIKCRVIIDRKKRAQCPLPSMHHIPRISRDVLTDKWLVSTIWPLTWILPLQQLSGLCLPIV